MKNEKYSHKDFSTRNLQGVVPPSELNDTEIVNSGFSQIEPFTECFPVGMTGVTFENCNLDNCIVPKDNIIKGGTNKQLKEQADGEMWIVGDKLEPVSPLKPYKFDKWGLSKDPKDIVTQATSRIPMSTKIGASIKLLSVTMAKEHKENLAMRELLADTEKLKSILIAEGKI